MPWVTPNIYPSTAAFYSPATACPSSWVAVSTASSGEQWVSGETGLTCCPSGFEGDGRGGCKVGRGGTFPVVKCGDADAEENERRVYTAGQWPVGVSAEITALQLRYRDGDVGMPLSTGGAGSRSSSSNKHGLSTGAKAAIGTIVPLVFIVGALAFAFLWRRRRCRKDAMRLAAEKNIEDEKDPRLSASCSRAACHFPSQHPHSDIKNPSRAPALVGTRSNAAETPEWNVEMDATEAERQGLVAHGEGGVEPRANELGGTARMARKPIAPVEIDGRSVRAEMGDAYLAYRPPGEEGRW